MSWDICKTHQQGWNLNIGTKISNQQPFRHHRLVSSWWYQGVCVSCSIGMRWYFKPCLSMNMNVNYEWFWVSESKISEKISHLGTTEDGYW